MNVIVYSPDPSSKPITLRVKEGLWEGDRYHDINDPELNLAIYYHAKSEGRWPKAEPVILRSADPQRVYSYAADVIRGRWPEGEKVILMSAKWAFFYTQDVVQGRWPEAEGTIKKDKRWWRIYREQWGLK